MNYFSYLYQCNMIRVFPLRAGVIVKRVAVICGDNRVSPACGGYRQWAASLAWMSKCFPCVRGLSGGNTRRCRFRIVFPLRGGYRARRPTHSRQLSVFPLRAGVIGAHNVVRDYVKSVSPVRGGNREGNLHQTS